MKNNVSGNAAVSVRQIRPGLLNRKLRDPRISSEKCLCPVGKNSDPSTFQSVTEQLYSSVTEQLYNGSCSDVCSFNNILNISMKPSVNWTDPYFLTCCPSVNWTDPYFLTCWPSVNHTLCSAFQFTVHSRGLRPGQQLEIKPQLL